MTVTSRTTKKGKQSNEKALQEWNLQPGVKTSRENMPDTPPSLTGLEGMPYLHSLP